jgi:hypothetical protein
VIVAHMHSQQLPAPTKPNHSTKGGRSRDSCAHGQPAASRSYQNKTNQKKGGSHVTVAHMQNQKLTNQSNERKGRKVKWLLMFKSGSFPLLRVSYQTKNSRW